MGVLYVLPGVLFVSGINKLFSSREPSPFEGQFSAGLMLAFLMALVVHAIGLCVAAAISSCFGTPEPNAAYALSLLLGDPKSEDSKAALEALSEHWPSAAAYFVSLSIASFLVGKQLNKYVKPKQKASWYNLLREEASFIWLTVDIEMGGVPYLFAGVLKEFSIGTDGSLERVVLMAAVRRTLKRPSAREMRKKDEKYQSGGWVEIPGEFVVLDMKRAQTVNVDYWYLEDEDSVQETSATPVDAPASDSN